MLPKVKQLSVVTDQEPKPIGPWNTFPDHGCKWIIGDPRAPGRYAWRCCGHPRAPHGVSYCPYHDRRSRQSGLSVVGS